MDRALASAERVDGYPSNQGGRRRWKWRRRRRRVRVEKNEHLQRCYEGRKVHIHTQKRMKGRALHGQLSYS